MITVSILLAVLLQGASTNQTYQAAPAAQDLTQKIEDAEAKTQKLEIVSRYKDYLLAQKEFDNLYQQFLGMDAVKASQKTMEAVRQELAQLELKVLKDRGLKREEFYLDFSTGEVKPVPKPQPPAAAPPAQ